MVISPFSFSKLFKIHGSEFKPYPIRNLGEATVRSITHSVFFFRIRKDPFRTQDYIILSFGVLDDITNIVLFDCFENFIEVIRKLLTGDSFHLVQRHYLTDIPWTLADISGMFSRDICRDPRINEAALYIKKHFAKPLTVEALAADCSFSTAAFIRRFGSAVGMTLGKWLIHCRMEHAAELLAASDYTIPEIAARCGYQSEFYFMNSFRKHYGVTAAEYRAGNRVK